MTITDNSVSKATKSKLSQNFTIALWGENLDRGCGECDRALAS
ncbi:hypothetical protein QUA26_04140 [Microcoleus sp. Pol12A4]